MPISTGPGYVQDPRTGNWTLVQNAATQNDALGRVQGGYAPGQGFFGADARLTSGPTSGANVWAPGSGAPGAQGGGSGIALPGQAGGGSVGSVGMDGNSYATGDAALEAARRQAFGSLGQGSNYFNSPLGQQAQGAIGNALSGVDVPYTQGVQDRMFGQQADLNAGTRASQDDLIRRQLAERGMEGSGAGLAAMLGAGRDQSAANSSALTGIQNQAQTENYAARERARNQAESFLSSRSSAEAPYRLKEADLLSRSEVTGQDPLGNALAGILGLQKQSALGSPQQGASLGLGSGGAFNVGGQKTVGPGSGSNTGISVGNTPTQALSPGGSFGMWGGGVSNTGGGNKSAQAQQAQNYRTPGGHSGYVPTNPYPAATQAFNQTKQWFGTNLGGMFG